MALWRKKNPECVVVEVGGFGVRVWVPRSTSTALPESGESLFLYTHLEFNAQDGMFSLFGFATETEREVFRIFLSISGIGPRKALAILSQIQIKELTRAIRDKNLVYLSKIKGVGKKNGGTAAFGVA